VDPEFTARGERLKVLAEAAALAQPSERALHDPPSRDDFEAALALPLAHDLKDPAAEAACPLEELACIRPVDPDLLQAWSAIMQPSEHQASPISVWDVGAMNDRREQQTVCVYEDVTLATGDFLSGVVAVRVPLLPAVLMLWLSSTAALGLRLRPCLARLSSRSTS
jgi:hypothetical protein